MKWLTIDYIKQHARIDFDDETNALELYASAAENTVLSLVRRTIDNVRDLHGGKIPEEYYQAALLLTTQGYEHRSPASPTNMSIVPYGFDMLIKPHMRLDGRSDLQAERDTLTEQLSTVIDETAFDYYCVHTDATEEQTQKFNDVMMRMEKTMQQYGDIKNPTARMCQMLRSSVSDYRKECEQIFKD